MRTIHRMSRLRIWKHSFFKPRLASSGFHLSLVGLELSDQLQLVGRVPRLLVLHFHLVVQVGQELGQVLHLLARFLHSPGDVLVVDGGGQFERSVLGSLDVGAVDVHARESLQGLSTAHLQLFNQRGAST